MTHKPYRRGGTYRIGEVRIMYVQGKATGTITREERGFRATHFRSLGSKFYPIAQIYKAVAYSKTGDQSILETPNRRK